MPVAQRTFVRGKIEILPYDLTALRLSTVARRLEEKAAGNQPEDYIYLGFRGYDGAWRLPQDEHYLFVVLVPDRIEGGTADEFSFIADRVPADRRGELGVSLRSGSESYRIHVVHDRAERKVYATWEAVEPPSGG